MPRAFQSPRGDFGFLNMTSELLDNTTNSTFQSPRGDFGFLNEEAAAVLTLVLPFEISIPSRGFWFFERHGKDETTNHRILPISIPSRGFWFFERILYQRRPTHIRNDFNPLAGILVF